MTEKIHYHFNDDKVYLLPKDGVCPFCEDYIAEDVDTDLYVCVGCNRLYDTEVRG